MGIDFKHFNTELETLYLKYDGTNDVLDVGLYEKCNLVNGARKAIKNWWLACKSGGGGCTSG